MADFLVLPEAFVAYVTSFRRLPVPPDTDLGALRAVIETVTLEAVLDLDAPSAATPERPARP